MELLKGIPKRIHFYQATPEGFFFVDLVEADSQLEIIVFGDDGIDGNWNVGNMSGEEPPAGPQATTDRGV